MGGLVARHFIELPEGGATRGQLITFGTPYAGALGSVGMLVNGKKIKFFDLTDVSSLDDGRCTNCCRSTPATTTAAGKLPAHRRGGRPEHRPGEGEGGARVPHGRSAPAVEQAPEGHRSTSNNRYDIRPIARHRATDAASRRSSKGAKARAARPSHGADNLMGDGTVPLAVGHALAEFEEPPEQSDSTAPSGTRRCRTTKRRALPAERESSRSRNLRSPDYRSVTRRRSASGWISSTGRRPGPTTP